MERTQLGNDGNQGRRRPLVSLVTPAYNEAENVPLIYERLAQVLAPLDVDWEWIVVDDHSADGTFAAAADVTSRDPRVRAIRLARNVGSHAALTCGLRHTRGDCAVIMAADLQHPPEALPALLDQWREGAQVVWAVRGHREDRRFGNIGFSRLYYVLMRHVVGMKQMPATGADFFLLDRRVTDALNLFNESNVSVLALITWMGYRQASIICSRPARLHGRSGWTLRKKLNLVVDSVTSFTYLPLRVMLYLGFPVTVIGAVYGGVVTINAMAGRPVQGWSALLAAVLAIGGIQMVMMGVLGEYLWRALAESRRRPRYLIEAAIGYGLESSSGRTGNRGGYPEGADAIHSQPGTAG